MQPGQTSILPDPQLRENAADVEKRLAACAGDLSLQDLQDLMDRAARGVFDSTMDSIAADTGAIWLADPGRTKMTVGYSHREPALTGREQPLDEGLISLVLASEHAICENNVYQNEQHSKRIDEALNFITCAMIAVPFYLGGAPRGVISCVQLKQQEADPDPPGFSAAHLARVQQLSTTVERLLNYRLLKILFDLNL